MNALHLKRGRSTEDLVLKYLQSYGLKLISRNFSTRVGELDLVMKDDNDLVFVEVRYRKSDGFGDAAESVDFRKQSKLRKAAEYYLQQHAGIDYQGCRFDVVGVTGNTIDWIKDAF